VGSFVIKDITGSGTLGGLGSATFTLGGALSSVPLSRLMFRRGRRPGLQLGYLLATIGGVIAVFGAHWQTLAVFLLGQFLFGCGQASNLLGRYAATDLAEPDQRSRAISRVIVCATFGAVLGPLLVAPAQRFAESIDVYRYSGPYLFSTVFYLGAMLNVMLRLRPDPLAVDGRLAEPGTDPPKPPPVLSALAVIQRIPRARLALLSMVISQTTMVAVMTMTPLHMKDHGHEGISQYVISLHIAGMYAFSPFIGRYSDRAGRLPAIVAGGALLVASTLMAAAAGELVPLLFVALWALGLGWNFGLIGGSALLTESVPVDDRVAVQGSADLTMSVCGAVAGFGSGFIREAAGYHTLSLLGTALAGTLLVVAFLVLQTSRRLPDVPLPAAGGG
jgi:MFS family permease